jgi:hypothetical protein
MGRARAQKALELQREQRAVESERQRLLQQVPSIWKQPVKI